MLQSVPAGTNTVGQQRTPPVFDASKRVNSHELAFISQPNKVTQLDHTEYSPLRGFVQIVGKGNHPAEAAHQGVG
jgi:hypothetical protein